MSFKVKSIDHLVLTVADIERTLQFYERVLGMQPIIFGDDRHALEFGHQKINLREAGSPWKPNALTPTAGSADLCFLIDGTARDAAIHLQVLGIAIENGPVERAGANGKALRSVYFRDPDGNLVELAEVIEEDSATS
jgi:catechol 2,3-dioxygenase-like lactoylglutathione lyase family enzyme